MRKPLSRGSLLPVFGVRVSVAIPLVCVHVIFSSVWIAEWPLFGLTVCSLCVWTICNFGYFAVWF